MIEGFLHNTKLGWATGVQPLCSWSAASPSASPQSCTGVHNCFPFPQMLLQLLQLLIQMCEFSHLRKGPSSSRSPTLARLDTVKAKVPVFLEFQCTLMGPGCSRFSPLFISIFSSLLPAQWTSSSYSDMIQKTYRLLNQFPQLLKTKFLC